MCRGCPGWDPDDAYDDIPMFPGEFSTTYDDDDAPVFDPVPFATGPSEDDGWVR